eukprot:TRINITY_DN866_c0_g1_i10.p1 TRINITY_DN866_c0_g1~~TRINITY_DN866_c0_g1_i10.p1  ORF type:complete len:458 (-),score=50.38 TRINITY_DN866_c0_g1_i10:128-1447(-)
MACFCLPSSGVFAPMRRGLSSTLWRLAFALMVAFALRLTPCDGAVLKSKQRSTLDSSSTKGRQALSMSELAAVGEPKAVGFKTEITALKRDYPFFHTSAELSSSLRDLSRSCKNANLTVRRVSSGDVDLEVVNVRKIGTATSSHRIFIIAGEHARELIGSETALRFLEALCGLTDGGIDTATVLGHNEFQVVLNSNPRSRVAVEQGDYCLRVNPAGVDLNRNWDVHWNEGNVWDETFPGQAPFSEPETRILKAVAEKFRPTAFVSVHSGTLGMYTPWAWSPDQPAERGQSKMMSLLKPLDAKHCRCPFGAAGREVGYASPGSSLDYIYGRLKANFSVAFEIWAPPSQRDPLRLRWQDKIAQARKARFDVADLSEDSFRDVFNGSKSDFAWTEARDAMDHADPLQCLEQFNPTTAAAYSETVNNWATALVELSRSVGWQA